MADKSLIEEAVEMGKSILTVVVYTGVVAVAFYGGIEVLKYVLNLF